MRLISTLKQQDEALALSQYLKSQGIDNEMDIARNTDWGSSSYSDLVCRVWVYDEDKLHAALQIAKEFQENPHDPKYTQTDATLEKVLQPLQELARREANLRKIRVGRPKPAIDQTPMGKITLYFILLCSLIFGSMFMSAPKLPLAVPKNLPLLPILASETQKNLMFDYPKAYQLVDELTAKYGTEKLASPETLPPEGQALYQQAVNTPYWMGVYPLVISHFNGSKEATPTAPLFEKEHTGEFWRLFTPAILHYDFLHLLFNMLMLAFLGKQLEARLGSVRYLIFIFITGVLTNTAQYLVSGPNFLGFSGILCAMVTFLWVRQRIAPWEGYMMQKSSFDFIMVFILGLFALQVLSFFLEIFTQTSIAPGIANTAHLTGAAAGLILGRLPFFSQRT